jgi:predicted dehydrogenase
MKTCIIIGAGGRGKDSYSPYINETKIMKIAGVAEPDLKKRTEFCEKYNIPEDMAFSDYRLAFEAEKSRIKNSV